MRRAYSVDCRGVLTARGACVCVWVERWEVSVCGEVCVCVGYVCVYIVTSYVKYVSLS